MAAVPDEKVPVPVSREILAEVDDVMHLGPEATVDYVLKDFVRHVQARRAGLAVLVSWSPRACSMLSSWRTRAVTGVAACDVGTVSG